MRHVAWVMTGLLIVASGSVSFAVEPYPEKNLGLTSTGSSSGPQSEAAADKKPDTTIGDDSSRTVLRFPERVPIGVDPNVCVVAENLLFEIRAESTHDRNDAAQAEGAQRDPSHRKNGNDGKKPALLRADVSNRDSTSFTASMAA